jgi:hypothetical protein
MSRLLKHIIPRRFSLRVLLLAIAVLAGIFAWYGNRLRAVIAERVKLAGKWHLVDPNGGIIWVDGKAYEVKFNPGMRLLPPNGNVGQFDFYESGSSDPVRAIYRIAGNRITVSQAEQGQARPVDFDASKGYSVWTCERVTDLVPSSEQ